ncbi:UvrD-helicase domain-containing protein [candidate division KSB1 bacterium]|nr:UvrD-helicase domain-containing protein [candidate division KSB1 bacterium]
MKIIADLHIHSYLSRATSSQLNLEHLNKWAQLKGIQIIGTGDITHPKWLAELKDKLEPAEDGLFKLKSEIAAITADDVPPACKGIVRFLLSTEISNIYKKNGQVRKVHNVVFMPHFAAAEKFQQTLNRIGNIHSDGRPILGLDSKDLLEIVLETDEKAYLVPAHIWTPWFSVLGSKSGFDSIEECYEELTPKIFAVETGLSSDPAMNWRLSQLDKFALISNSDAHSPAKLGREANQFDTELAYSAIFDALKGRNPAQFLGTIEFYPEEGKYHLDGHRKCNMRMTPRETLESNGLCPVCGKKVTVGVMHRVEQLADRKAGFKPETAAPFRSFIPLPEIISEVQGVGPNTKSVNEIYDKMLLRYGSEFDILETVPLEDIDGIGNPILTEGIRRFRNGEVQIAAGYDGEFGSIKLFQPEERKEMLSQLFFFEGDTPAPKVRKTEKSSTAKSDKITSKNQSVSVKKWETRDAFDAIPEENALMSLNPAQNEAASFVSSPLLIIAGPGTGKTRTLTHRIAYLIHKLNISPEKILALTFTNHAADEMKARLSLLLSQEQVAALTVKTFHAFGSQFLRDEAASLKLSPDFILYDEYDKFDVLRQLHPDLKQKELNSIADLISEAKNKLLSPDDCIQESGLHLPEFIEMYRKYETALERNGALDYDDLIFKSCLCLQQHHEIRKKCQDRYHWISVDEYQDINYAQYHLLRLLLSSKSNLCAIGDPDQAIYGFRGSDRRYFLRFREDYPRARIMHLAQNYRSTTQILTASKQVISKNQDRMPTEIWSEIFSDMKIEIGRAPTEKAEAEYVVHQIERMVGGTGFFSMDSGRIGSEASESESFSFSDFAVLYRLSAQCAPLEEAFLRSGMPYQTTGDTPFFERTSVKHVLSYLKILHKHEADLDLLRILNIPPRGIGEKSVQEIVSYCRKRQISIYEGIEQAPLISGLSNSVKQALKQFYQLIQELHFEAEKLSIAELIRIILDETGLKAYHPQNEQQQTTWQTLIENAQSYADRLGKFLEDTALRKETDEYDPRAERVTLMSLHASKGLEFPVVFIVGCEETLLPYLRENESQSVARLEEERRLLYVGMTRARKKLVLLHANKRFLFGKTMLNERSRFLNDIEKKLLDSHATLKARKLQDQPKPDTQINLFS